MSGTPSGTLKRPLTFKEEESDLEVWISEESDFSDDEQPSFGPIHDCTSPGGRGRHRGPPGSAPPHQCWKSQDDPDEAAPTHPRFFPKRPPGVQPPLNLGNPSPGEIFSRFVDAQVLQHLVESTNKKAAAEQEEGKTFAWMPVSNKELKEFMGLLLYMSVVRLPQISDYWRQGTIFQVHHPATVMSRDRFRTILSNLHISDPKADEDNNVRKDPIHQVRSFLDMVRLRCRSFYHPKQHLAVGERMGATKARRIKKYMKVKPMAWGLRLFALVDISGYTVDFVLHTGKDSTPVSGNGLFYDVTVELVRKEHLGTGYIICMDNFNTSPQLFQHLIQERFDVCGLSQEGRNHVLETKEKVSIPNRYKRGVDTSSQMLGTRSIQRKTKRWTMTVFQRLMDICVTNSFAIHREVCAAQQRAPMSPQQFTEELAAHLLGTSLKCGPPPPAPDHTHHFPDPTSSGNEASQRSTKGRRICRLCKRCTSWMCKLCNAPLCLQPDRNCFKQFHINQPAVEYYRVIV